MNSPFICCLFFVGFSLLQCTVLHSKKPDKSPKENNSQFFDEPNEKQLSAMLDVNDDIRHFLLGECNKLRFPMEEITILGKSINFLALDDNEMLRMQPLHSYLTYINGVCDGIENQMSRLADGRYDQYLASIPYNLSADQIFRLGNPSRLEWAAVVTNETFTTIRSIFEEKETKTAMELAELKKLKISSEIIKLSSSIKEIELGIESLLSITKIENDFLKNVQEMSSDLEKHVQQVLELDDLIDRINKSIKSIVNSQMGLPKEVALSFIV